MGIIDCLSEGFNRITKRLWLILIPAAVDVVIWRGPKLSINALSLQLQAMLPNMPELGEQFQQMMQTARESLAALGAQSNVMSIVSLRSWLLPILARMLTPGPALNGPGQVVQIPSWPMLGAVVIFLMLLSLLLSCFLLALMAHEAREESINWLHAVRVALHSWVRLSALASLAACALLLASFLLSMAAGLLAIVSLTLAEWVILACEVGFLWIVVYASILFFFVMRAIILDNVGLARALWNGLNVVQRGFYSAFGFLLLTIIIETGLLFIWQRLAMNTLGTIAGILGNAYVTSGLVMASLIYYRERFVAWQEATAPPKREQGRP